ncbi:MAG: hypothetical protein G01um10143_835 [Parcubacteria group bacterium Gr01-1014_3]|nr:MAG: hypothetical protein G01um10143_835 [Parcubacteria group bacterium Gr01-1014_3]
MWDQLAGWIMDEDDKVETVEVADVDSTDLPGEVNLISPKELGRQEQRSRQNEARSLRRLEKKLGYRLS